MLDAGGQRGVDLRDVGLEQLQAGERLGPAREVVERVDEFRAMAELGVDLGQGFYFGQPTDKPMAVDSRLVRPSMS